VSWVPVRASASSYLLDRKLSDEDEPLQIGGHKATEFVDRVLGKGLCREYARVVDDAVILISAKTPADSGQELRPRRPCAP